MNEILKLDNIFQYNDMMGQETLHPLVSVVDFSKCKPMLHSLQRFGFYAVFLKDVKCGDIRYGRNYYDYQEGTLVFLAPGQVVGIVNNGEYFQPKGWALLFHPDLIRGTSLVREMKNYTFFSYESNEALHLSEQERKVILDCFHNIESELQHAIDKHSKTLIVNNIELFLNYCVRFYDRQFITRSHVNKDILTRFENLLNDYLQSARSDNENIDSIPDNNQKQDPCNLTIVNPLTIVKETSPHQIPLVRPVKNQLPKMIKATTPGNPKGKRKKKRK